MQVYPGASRGVPGSCCVWLWLDAGPTNPRELGALSLLDPLRDAAASLPGEVYDPAKVPRCGAREERARALRDRYAARPWTITSSSGTGADDARPGSGGGVQRSSMDLKPLPRSPMMMRSTRGMLIRSAALFVAVVSSMSSGLGIGSPAGRLFSRNASSYGGLKRALRARPDHDLLSSTGRTAGPSRRHLL